MPEEHLLRGRRRRYFGYMADIANKVDTPESAKSFRSVISPVTRKVKWKYQPVKSFKPDPPGQSRFADKILHRAIKTQIPGLLPALKNSPQFDDEHDESLKIYLRSPEYEQHKQRSLHYFWLPRNERTELCGIFRSHLKPDKRKGGKRFVPVGKRTQVTGLAAETAILEQQEYLDSIANDPRFASNKTRAFQRLPHETPSRIFRMNRKFQISYWDPTFNKHLVDPFRRTRGKLPACDAICHEHFETAPEPKDILTCLHEYRKRYDEIQDLSGEPISLSDKREKLRRLSLNSTLEDEEKRRGIKHIKALKEYDRESEALWTKQAKLMISAAEYINKIKKGRRFPTPPRELREKKWRKNDDGVSARSEASSINVEEYLRGKTENVGGNADGGHGHHQSRQRGRKHHHFHHKYNSEDFYMEMYLHFLNPEEDVSLKAPPHQLTDVKELRKQMNLDEDEEKGRKLIDMLNESSLEALHTMGETQRKSVSSRQSLTSQEVLHEKEILERQIARLKNPRLVRILTGMLSQISIKADSISMTSSDTKKSPVEEDDVDDEQKTSSQPQPATTPTDMSLAGKQQRQPDFEDDDLDKMGDIPEHELRLIMSEIAGSSKGSSVDNLSSDSSGGEEEEEGEGEGADADDDALKLFKKARKKKDSVAEFMDLTTEFRARVCQNQMGKPAAQMDPFAEAVCILYPDGSEKKKDRKSRSGNKILANASRSNN